MTKTFLLNLLLSISTLLPAQSAKGISILMDAQDKAGRMSWDETAVLVAITGYRPYFKLKSGTIQITGDGSITWSEKGSNHSYLVEEQPASEVETIINQMMQHQPK